MVLLDFDVAMTIIRSFLQAFKRSLFDRQTLGKQFVPLQQRSVWLTYTDSQALTDANHIQSTIAQLAELGFNTIYPVVWQRGHTLYPSSVAAKVTGSSTLPNSPFQNRNMMAELVCAAKPYGLRVIPWLEYGLMAPPQSPLAQQHPDWLTQKNDRSMLHNGMVWLNPVHPDVCQFMVELIYELVNQYDIDGIQLDDHFALPVSLGYDDFTAIQYCQQTGREPPKNSADRHWMLWRADRLTDLMRQVSQAVKSDQPDCRVSLSPNPYSFSLSQYLVDWQRWIQEGLIDELVVQLYRDQLAALKAELSKSELIAARECIPVSIGLLSGLRTKSVSLEQIQQQVSLVRQQGFTGVSFFFYETVVHQMLDPKTVGDRSAKQWQRILS